MRSLSRSSAGEPDHPAIASLGQGALELVGPPGLLEDLAQLGLAGGLELIGGQRAVSQRLRLDLG